MTERLLETRAGLDKSDAWRRERCLDTERDLEPRSVLRVESNGNKSDALSNRAVPGAESYTWVNKRCLMMEAILDSKSEFLESKRSGQDSGFNFLETIFKRML